MKKQRPTRIKLSPHIPDKTRRHKRKGCSDVGPEVCMPRSKRAPALVQAWARLHILSSHSPIAVEKKWARANKKFYHTHFGVNGTMRYLNAYSCHSFL